VPLLSVSIASISLSLNHQPLNGYLLFLFYLTSNQEACQLLSVSLFCRKTFDVNDFRQVIFKGSNGGWGRCKQAGDRGWIFKISVWNLIMLGVWFYFVKLPEQNIFFEFQKVLM
jgi:hypothetical protein